MTRTILTLTTLLTLSLCPMLAMAQDAAPAVSSRQGGLETPPEPSAPVRTSHAGETVGTLSGAVLGGIIAGGTTAVLFTVGPLQHVGTDEPIRDALTIYPVMLVAGTTLGALGGGLLGRYIGRRVDTPKRTVQLGVSATPAMSGVSLGFTF